MRKFLFKFLRYSGLPFLFREILQRNKVTILLYHDLSLEDAERTFPYLSRKYNIIRLEDFIRACDHPQKVRLPKKAMVITFDDGLATNYKLLPLLKRLQLPITIFLCAGIVDTRRRFWFNFEQLPVSKKVLKKLPYREKLKILEQVGFAPQKEFENPEALSAAQIEEMKHYVNFQSHTMFHPCLPYCDNQSAWFEIADSKRILELQFGLDVDTITYPNGDYCSRTIQMVQKAGYRFGLTVDSGYNTPTTDPFRLKRLGINDTGDLNELIVKACGLWAFLLQIFRRRKKFGYVKNGQQKYSTYLKRRIA